MGYTDSKNEKEKIMWHGYKLSHKEMFFLGLPVLMSVYTIGLSALFSYKDIHIDIIFEAMAVFVFVYIIAAFFKLETKLTKTLTKTFFSLYVITIVVLSYIGSVAFIYYKSSNTKEIEKNYNIFENTFHNVATESNIKNIFLLNPITIVVMKDRIDLRQLSELIDNKAFHDVVCQFQLNEESLKNTEEYKKYHEHENLSRIRDSNYTLYAVSENKKLFFTAITLYTFLAMFVWLLNTMYKEPYERWTKLKELILALMLWVVVSAVIASFAYFSTAKSNPPTLKILGEREVFSVKMDTYKVFIIKENSYGV